MRLEHGDCFEVMERLADEGIQVDCVIADPPYGTTYEKWDEVLPPAELFERIRPLLKAETPVAVFGTEPMISEYRLAAKGLYKYDLIWDKGRGVDFMRANYKPMNCFENIAIFSLGRMTYGKGAVMTYNPQMLPGTPYKATQRARKPCSIIRQPLPGLAGPRFNKGERFPLTIIRFNKNAANKTKHATEKPLDLIEWLVKTYSDEGGTVLDFCMGSGTTGVACKRLGRDFIGIEKDKGIFDAAAERINGAREELAFFKELV